MNRSSETVFYIEQLQPENLATKSQRWQYHISCGLIGGTFVGFTDGFINILANKPDDALINGIVTGLVFGGFISGLSKIRTIETLGWSWNEFKKGIKSGMFFGSILVPILTSIYILFLPNTVWAQIQEKPILFLLLVLIFGFTGALLFGFFGGLIGGFRGREIEKKEYPNQGIFASARNAVILGLIVALIWGLLSGLRGGLTYGLIGGLIGGATACIQHVMLRLILYMNRCSPWNYARFLDHATDRLLLQKVGGGYIFMHRMLLEHFAEMPLEQKRR